MKLRSHSAGLGTLFIIGTILFGSRAHAQATTASIHGTITDPHGAVLPNASVTALNTSTGIAASEKTDSKGYFIFPNLHIGGPYSVTVEDSGFQRFVATGIMLDLSSAREVNATLQIGTSSETVQVRCGQSRGGVFRRSTQERDRRSGTGGSSHARTRCHTAAEDLPRELWRPRIVKPRSQPTAVRPRRIPICWMEPTSTTFS